MLLGVKHKIINKTMNKEQIKANISKAFDNWTSSKDDFNGALYINIFNDVPRAFRIYYNDKNELIYSRSTNIFDRNTISAEVDDRIFIHSAIENADDDKIIVFSYSAYQYIVIFNMDNIQALFKIIIEDSRQSSSYSITAYTKEEQINSLFDYIKDWCMPHEKNKEISFGITAVDMSSGLYTTWYDYKNFEIDIEKNYNEDIPYHKMCEILETENKPELMLFYGEPGTGKTSLIKHFISKYHEKEFVFMDGTLLANVSQEKLMSYFLENQNTIFILEDCEKVLMNREHYANPVMPVLLNLTDGIIGDVLGIKLICTFNTSLTNIDKALIRKGRLSLKYEFKKLSKDKIQNIVGHEVDKDMTLADIYYEDEENDFSKKNTKKIGF